MRSCLAWVLWAYCVVVGVYSIWDNLTAGRGVEQLMGDVLWLAFVTAMLRRPTGVVTMVLATGCLVMTLLTGVLVYGIVTASALLLACGLRGDRRRAAVMVLVTLLWSAAAISMRPGELIADIIDLPLPPLIFVGVGFAIHEALERHRRAQALAEARLAEEKESRRLERAALVTELHDGIARALNSARVHQTLLDQQTTPEDRSLSRREIERATSEGLDHVHRLLRALREDGLAQTTPTTVDPGLVDSLDRATADIRATGRSVGVLVELPEVVPATVDALAARTVREGVTNILKHSPDGASCGITVRQEGGDLVTIVDSELGTAAAEPRSPSNRVGLESLRERTRLLGGTFEAGPTRGRVLWRLRVSVPLSPLLDAVTVSFAHAGIDVTGPAAAEAMSQSASRARPAGRRAPHPTPPTTPSTVNGRVSTP
ncbi:sensor histidine kinase [Mobilicoccus pelagius]|uniref:sensor histidine kinase n=1 Tax=Mobilicoccus pelagius TaxID=746032 RepID=UPI00145C80FC|nr:histidine kinase [Mobilicoccus pelagius]